MREETLTDTIAEAGVIASIIQMPMFATITPWLKPTFFSDNFNAVIYEHLCRMVKRGSDKIDTFGLLAELQTTLEGKSIVSTLGNTRIEALVEDSKFIARENHNDYIMLAKRIAMLSYKSQLAVELEKLAKGCRSETEEGVGAIERRVYERVQKLANTYTYDDSIRQFGEDADRVFADIVKRRNATGVFGIPSKYDLLHTWFSYEAGEMTIIKGRMKEGKSMFMMCEAIDKAKRSIPTLCLDTEMSDRLWMERAIAHISGISVNKVKTGLNADGTPITQEEEIGIKKAIAELKILPIAHIYRPEWTLDDIYLAARGFQYKYGLEFLVFDYLKSNQIGANDQYNELGAKADFLKNKIAGEMNIHVLAGAQLNRQHETADSDKLDRYCTTSILWARKTKEQLARSGTECGNYALNIQYNRIGEQQPEDDWVDFKVDGATMRIELAEQHSTGF